MSYCVAVKKNLVEFGSERLYEGTVLTFRGLETLI